MSIMKKLLVAILIMAMLLAGCSNTTTTPSGEKINTDNAVAVVNENVVTLDTFKILYSIYANAYRQAYGDDVLERVYDEKPFGDILKEDIYNMLIQDALLSDFVKTTGYEVDPDEVATNLEELKTSLQDDPDTSALYESLGVGDAFLEDQIVAGILRTEFANVINGEIEADTNRLDDMYENYAVQVAASHILVEDDVTAALVEEKIKAGEDFATLAGEYSQDPGSASAGGSLGYFARGVMVPEFEDVAFSLAIGEISAPVQSDYGFHIIKVDDIKTVNSMIADGETEDVINVYKSQISSDLFEEYYTAKMDELEAAAAIEKFFDKVTDLEPITVTTTTDADTNSDTSTESDSTTTTEESGSK